jgi:DNA modification methylase
MKPKTPRTLGELTADPKNARRHTARNLAAIDASLAAVGAGRGIVIDERDVVLAGNATTARAQLRGMKLKVVDGDRNTIVAVRRTDLTDEEKVTLALYDNRAAELAEWDPAALQALRGEGYDLTGIWQAKELARIMEALDEPHGGLTDPDAVPPVPASTSIQLGDLYSLGEHRLLCGDSTALSDVGRLMGDERADLFATDPPYLVDYTGTVAKRSKKGPASEATADWDDAKQGGEFFDRFIACALALAIRPHAAWYTWHASRRQALLEGAWEKAGAFVHQQIIWVKTHATFGRSVFMWRHEPCLFGWVRSQKPRVRQAPLPDGASRLTVWEPPAALPDGVDLPTSTWYVPSAAVEVGVDHPTVKPTQLFVIPLLMHTAPGDLCYEPFSGSGTQIIAAESTKRRCYAMEREPRYVQQAITRWEAFTGEKARRLGRAAKR